MRYHDAHGRGPSSGGTLPGWVRSPKSDAEEIPAVLHTRDEARRLLDGTARPTRSMPSGQWPLATGMRVGELIGFWSGVNLELLRVGILKVNHSAYRHERRRYRGQVTEDPKEQAILLYGSTRKVDRRSLKVTHRAPPEIRNASSAGTVWKRQGHRLLQRGWGPTRHYSKRIRPVRMRKLDPSTDQRPRPSVTLQAHADARKRGNQTSRVGLPRCSGHSKHRPPTLSIYGARHGGPCRSRLALAMGPDLLRLRSPFALVGQIVVNCCGQSMESPHGPCRQNRLGIRSRRVIPS